jgi:hypothetical protein
VFGFVSNTTGLKLIRLTLRNLIQGNNCKGHNASWKFGGRLANKETPHPPHPRSPPILRNPNEYYRVHRAWTPHRISRQCEVAKRTEHEFVRPRDQFPYWGPQRIKEFWTFLEAISCVQNSRMSCVLVTRSILCMSYRYIASR